MSMHGSGFGGGGGANKPLSGLRVLDASHVFAIPFATTMLADLGADVIKIQTHTRMDVMSSYGPFPENDPAERSWDRVGCLNTVNRGKRGISLDLTKSEGIDIFRKLVGISDVLAESFTPRVMKKFGLDYESLCRIKPDLVMLSNTGYGHSGPWSEYGSVATSLEGTSGMCWLSGFEDGPPSKVGQSYTDFLAAWNAAYAILLCLFQRRRTGKGQWIDLAMYQAGAQTIGPAIMDAQANGRIAARTGNRHPSLAPHNVYPCAGTDRWIAIAVDCEDAWTALKREMGSPAWMDDPRYRDMAGRLAAVHEIDRGLGEWTKDKEAAALAGRLQAAGVTAGAVENGRDLHFDEQMSARGFLENVAHPDESGIGVRPYIGRPWKMSGAELGSSLPAPMLGQDNVSILTELLGYSTAEAEALAEKGVIADTPAAMRPLRPLQLDQMRKKGRIGVTDPNYRKLLKLDGVPGGRDTARASHEEGAAEALPPPRSRNN